MTAVSFKDYLERPEVRAAILKQFSVKHAENWQSVVTPGKVVRGMVDLVKDSPELLYCILFNLEFLEELVFIRGIERERIMIMADTEQEGAVAMGVYGVKAFVLPLEVREPKKAIELVAEKIGKAFYNGGDMPKSTNLVVFGNPPYQSEDGGHGKSAKPIYHLFVEAVIKHLRPKYHSFIIPSRWMLGGKGLDKFRAWMLSGAPASEPNKKHISSIVDFKSATDVFEADIAGGVCYYLWDREHDGDCEYGDKVRKLDEEDVFIRDNIGVDILKKVKHRHRGAWMDSIVSARKPYGFDADTTPTATGVPCWFKQSQGKLFVDPAIVKDPRKDLGKWKVLAPYAPIAGQTDFNQPVGFFTQGNLFVAAPGECCTETYIVLNSFNTEDEAKNFRSYVMTKFFRFQLLLRVVSQHIVSGTYAWVPYLGSYAAAPTDDQLFAQFGLSPAEIEHIKGRVK